MHGDQNELETPRSDDTGTIGNRGGNYFRGQRSRNYNNQKPQERFQRNQQQQYNHGNSGYNNRPQRQNYNNYYRGGGNGRGQYRNSNYRGGNRGGRRGGGFNKYQSPKHQNVDISKYYHKSFFEDPWADLEAKEII
ncbi:11886_t:CDS:2 [Entrophospora sp. SA101]|nr:14823_t:CDS:2 [Entrophospora sp. SA101]CAJ0876317.1 14834_t:CDS:2 [Entrophospora sp. SA101]CAJ0925146.1 11886_t:CDS:2 [Entrophospora sp. SA101]